MTKAFIKELTDDLDALAKLREVLADDLAATDAMIADLLASQVDSIPELSNHIINSGGKRLRPLLTLASAKAFGYVGDKHIPLAACVEFIHTATLLHDDVVDESKLRRGMRTANEVWGNKKSILVGDFLLGKAFQLMVQGESLPIMDLLSRTAVRIAEGEVMQLEPVTDIAEAEGYYVDMISAKTACLFATACELGPILAKRPESEQVAMREFGLAVGRAFQIIDDALDYVAFEGTLGKSVGDDFKEGKVTLPVIKAYQAGNRDEKVFWRRTLLEQDQGFNDFEHALSLINKYDAVDASLCVAGDYAKAAQQYLSAAPESEFLQLLRDVVDFVLKRAH